MRPNPSSIVGRWFSAQRPEELHTTVITVAEILYGIELLPAGKRKDTLVAGSERMFNKLFLDRIFAFNNDAAHSFPKIAAERRRLGRPITELDAQIAAIASIHGAAIATRNTSDFEGCGIRVLNPWLD
jgi:predicted nucleic acid-binding protein